MGIDLHDEARTAESEVSDLAETLRQQLRRRAKSTPSFGNRDR